VATPSPEWAQSVRELPHVEEGQDQGIREDARRRGRRHLDGTTDWQQQFQVSPGQTGASVPAVTMNNGSENIAEVDTSGNLDFYWQDSSGHFHAEAVDT
jgi:hypothetical protein